MKSSTSKGEYIRKTIDIYFLCESKVYFDVFLNAFKLGNVRIHQLVKRLQDFKIYGIIILN
jgi:hypothetical protein